MKQNQVKITVYGNEKPCPSCLHSPSSKETFEWLQAALRRKYPNQPFLIEYIDFENPAFASDPYVKEIVAGDLFYPAVVLNGELVGEGNPQLKTICLRMEKHGYVPE